MPIEIKINDLNDHFERIHRICSKAGSDAIDFIVANPDEWATDAVWAAATNVDEYGVGVPFSNMAGQMNEVRLFVVLTLLTCDDDFFEGIFAQSYQAAKELQDQDGDQMSE